MKHLHAFLLLALSTGLSSCRKDAGTAPSATDMPAAHRIAVTDAGGMPRSATVSLFHTEEDLRNDTLCHAVLQTGADGLATLNGEPPSLYAKAKGGGMTSEFLSSVFTVTTGNGIVTYGLRMAVPTAGQRLCGHGTKRWLMTEYLINGSPQPYEVVSVLNADGTWTDSNDRSGAWAFNTDTTRITYDYDGSGITMTFDILQLTLDSARFSMAQPGMSMEMLMVAI